MDRTGYSTLQIALHWAVALLILVSFLSEDMMKAAYRAVERGQAVTDYPILHIGAGLAVLALTLIRLAIRARSGAPALPPTTPKVVSMAARVGHYVLYGLLFAIPLTGVTTWFLSVEVTGEVHEIMGNLLLFVIGLHAAAALFHQFILKDGLLLRMFRPN